jgi:hypothetical protein
MDSKKMSIAAICGTLAVCAITVVTADSSTHTPLYTVRMEQASSKMNFLPIKQNTFTYSTEQGCFLNYDVTENGEPSPVPTGYPDTCWPQCTTIEATCEDTCPDTCYDTCPTGCSTFPPTCMETCPETCYDTCEPTCEEETCPATCYDTCTTCSTCQGQNTCFMCQVTCDTCEPYEELNRDTQ